MEHIQSTDGWLRGERASFFNMITTSIIDYTVAIVETRYEYWDQFFVLKNMTHNECETYMRSEGYNQKKYFMQQVGRQRQYCGTRLSTEGVTFYKHVWKQWKTFSSGGIW